MIWIKVLAPSRREKGQAFELFMRQVLDAAGISPIRTRLRVSGKGLLLDVRGRQRSDATPCLIECQALSREVALDEVKRFYSRFRRERKKSKKLRGVLLACTPLSPKVRSWYQALEGEVRQSLHLLEPEVVTATLAAHNHLRDLTASENELSVFSTLPRGPYFLATLGGNLYWVQTLLLHNRPTAFVVLEGRGGPAAATIAREIKRLDPSLRDKRLLDQGIRNRILLELLPNEPRTANELAQTLNEPLQDILSMLQWLDKEGVVTSQRAPGTSRRLDPYRLNKDFPTFFHLASLFLPGGDRFRFLASGFASQGLRTHLASYLEDRFRLKLTAEDLDAIVNLLSISPAALLFTIASPPNYILSDREMDAQFIPNGERTKLREIARTQLMRDLSLRAITDSFHQEFTTLLAARDIRAYLARIQLRAATLQQPLFSLQTVQLLTLPGVKPAAEAELALESGAVMRLIQEHDHAIQYLDRAIQELKDPVRLKVAWNTKGLCLFSKRRYQHAIECFNEAIRLDGDLKQAWFNKAICLREVGDTLGALRCVKRALEIDPGYKEAKDLLQRFQS